MVHFGGQVISSSWLCTLTHIIQTENLTGEMHSHNVVGSFDSACCLCCDRVSRVVCAVTVCLGLSVL